MDKILVIRLSSFGDIVLTSPLLRLLRIRYPLAQIDVLVKSVYADLVRFNPNLTNVLEMRRGDWAELQMLVNQIQSERYDLLVDLHNSLRSRYIRVLAKAKRRVVIDKRVLARFALVKFKLNWYGSVVPVADRYLETCAPFGIQDDGKGLEMFIPDQTIETMATTMSKYRLTRFRNVIGFAPAAKHGTKRWLPERFSGLGTQLVNEHQAKILVFGGKEDVTYCNDIAQMINMQVGAQAAESVAGEFSIIETAAALDYCTLVVSNDTGIMHLAQARGRNLVAIFGSTVKEFGFFPTSPNSRVIERSDVPCRPCSHIGRAGCPKGHFACMSAITVDEVMTSVRELI